MQRLLLHIIVRLPLEATDHIAICPDFRYWKEARMPVTLIPFANNFEKAATRWALFLLVSF